jgi:hypothetical protein
VPIPIPVPVVCDRCRAEGVAGQDPFQAFGALLDFDPVPRRTERADGWDAEAQRAYIAALSLTGSDRAAARAVDKSAFGITQLLASDGCEGFAAAREEALAIAADERSRRLAEGLRAVAAEQAGWRPPPPPWSRSAGRRGRGRPAPPPEPVESPEAAAAREERDAMATLEAIFDYYMQRLHMERAARIEGRIVEADFYLRQITVAEICLDLMTNGHGLRALQELRAPDGQRYPSIASTTMSQLLDDARRHHWAALGEPVRPPAYGPGETIDKGTHILLAGPALQGGRDSWKEQEAKAKADQAAAAEAQIAWEEEARAEALAWRERLEAAQENPSPLAGEGQRSEAAQGEGPPGPRQSTTLMGSSS